MATRRSGTPPPTTIRETDRIILRVVKQLAGFAPANAKLGVPALIDLETRLNQAEETSFNADKTQVTARNVYADLGWEMHDTLQLVKAAVISQYGANSDEVQAIGLKKKVDYRYRRSGRQPRK
ncbi:MAG: hypothetical protein U0177_07350, partial [Kouleothrix sp.]